jgi:hypothetical protein
MTSAQGRVSRASRKYRMRNCTKDEGALSSSHGTAPKVERGPTTDIRGTNSKLQRSKTQTPSISNLNRIGEHSIWATFGSGRYEGSRHVIWPENVKDSLADGDQIIPK